MHACKQKMGNKKHGLCTSSTLLEKNVVSGTSQSNAMRTEAEVWHEYCCWEIWKWGGMRKNECKLRWDR